MARPIEFNEWLLMNQGSRQPQMVDPLSASAVAPQTKQVQIDLAANASADEPTSPLDMSYGLRLPASASIMAEYNSPENQALRSEMQKRFLESKAAQEGSINDLETQLRNYQGSSKVNLKPLLALADAWSDGESNLASAYQAPDSDEDRAYKAAQLQDLIAKRKGDVAKDELNYLKGQQSDKLGLRMFETEQRNARQARAYDKDTAKYVSDRFNKNIFGEGTARDFAQVETDFDTLQSNLQAGDMLSFGTAISNYSRQIGGQKGVLTDRDVQLLKPAILEAKMNEIQTFFDANPGKPLPPQFLAPYADIMNRIRGKIGEQKLSQLERTKNELSKTGFTSSAMEEGSGRDIYEMSRDRIKAFMGGRPQFQAQPERPETNTGDGPKPTPQAAPLSPTEWLRSKRAGSKAGG